MKRLFLMILAGVLLLASFSACSDTSPAATPIPSPILDPSDLFSDRDYRTDYDVNKSILIQLSGDSASASSNSVKISGSTVTITEEATYIVSGTLTDGMLVVNAPESAKLQIVLNGAAIHSKTSAALYILEADKVFVTLANGTSNHLSNGGSFVAVDENNIDAAVFSTQDLTFNGSGSLAVTSPAGHGIVCKDDLVFTGGIFEITSASHGLDANNSVRLGGAATLSITAGKDGIHCENTDDTSLGFVFVQSGTLSIGAEGDGISAGAYLQIEDGTFHLTTGGGSENAAKTSSGNYGGFGDGRPWEGPSSSGTTSSDTDSTSMKGMKAAGNILINAGAFSIDSADDTIHSDASVSINGGTFELKTGDDGIHAEDTLMITDCTMTLSESYEGLEAHKIYVQGGKLVLHTSDDGLNAAGGTDSSGTAGGRDGKYGGGPMGGRGPMGSGSSDGVIDISGGELTIYASGDGLDANGTLTISGGFVYITNPTAGDTSVLDSDQSPVITGGTFIGVGSTTMMAQTFSAESSQGVIACTTGSQQAGSVITITDASGRVVFSHEAEYSYVLIIISSPDLVKGETYTITIGSLSGDLQAS